MNFKEWLILENVGYNLILDKVLSIRNLEDLLIIKDYLEDNGIDQRIINCFIEKDKFISNLITVGKQLKPLPKKANFVPQNTFEYGDYILWNTIPDLDATWLYTNDLNYTRVHHLRRVNGNYSFEEIFRVLYGEATSNETTASIEEILDILPDFYDKKDMFNFLLCLVLIEVIEEF